MNADTYLKTLTEATPRRFAFNESSLEGAMRWQQAFRLDLARLLGLEAMAARGRSPLAAEQLATEEEIGYTRETWRLETEPSFWVPFYLLRPHLAGRRPLVVTPHGHYKPGKKTYAGNVSEPEEREKMEAGELDLARQAVREGYVVIAPDMRGFASLRRQQEIDVDANNSCRHLQMHAFLMGRTLIGERVWDVQRLIDWGVAREDVDADAIIVVGDSGGGSVTLFAAAVDERIRIAVPASYFCTFLDSIGTIHHCECNYVPGLMQLAEMADVAGLIAPRLFLAVNGRQDPIFPIEATQRSFTRLKDIYRVFGAHDRCELSIGEGGHRFYKKDVWPFVKRMLQEGRTDGEAAKHNAG